MYKIIAASDGTRDDLDALEKKINDSHGHIVSVVANKDYLFIVYEISDVI